MRCAKQSGAHTGFEQGQVVKIFIRLIVSIRKTCKIFINVLPFILLILRINDIHEILCDHGIRQGRLQGFFPKILGKRMGISRIAGHKQDRSILRIIKDLPRGIIIPKKDPDIIKTGFLKRIQRLFGIQSADISAKQRVLRYVFLQKGIVRRAFFRQAYSGYLG